MLRGLIFDLDGTLYTGDQEVPGAGAFVQTCLQRGLRCLFVTNRANRLPETVAAHLRSYGIPCEADDVLTTSQATAQLLSPGRAYVIGEDGLINPLLAAGFIVADQDVDYVIVGFDRAFSYDKLLTACRCIGAGGRFIATNPDRALHLETGMSPGTGALVAAVQAGSGATPMIIGKPERRIMDMALAKLALNADEVWAVGDNLETDIPAGAAAGMRTVLMLTGVSTVDDIQAAPVKPDCIMRTYAELEQHIRCEPCAATPTVSS